MQNLRVFVSWITALVVGLLFTDPVFAQSFRRGGTEFNAVRSVTVPAAEQDTVIVVEFFHHGEIHPDGKNVLVAARNKEPVPFRILQLGPGDVCRLAFQTVEKQLEYEIYYGGEPPRDGPPKWTAREGLLMETRQFRPCDFNSLDSVRKAFEDAEPIGADYVEKVFHGHNPFRLKKEPFLTRYTGYLDLKKAGVYGFITSSRDCSFLLIDDKLVASSPGYHGPMYRAQRGSRHDVKLSAGRHKFEYYHAAAGPDATIALYWEIDPANETPQRPTLVPAEIFQWHLIGHLPAGHLVLRTVKQPPDFLATLAGAVPLPDNDVPLVGVLFRDNSPKTLTMQGAKIRWDFGDGQTSDLPNADHVYLRPGIYAVKLSIRRGGKPLEIVNHVNVDVPLPTAKEVLHSLDDCLKIIKTYDPKTLDAASLKQLVLVYEAKSQALVIQAEEAAAKAQSLEEDPNRKKGTKSNSAIREMTAAEDLLAESDRYLVKAVEAGQAAFAKDAATKDDQDLLTIARHIGPLARNRLGDSQAAFQIWRGAAARVQAGEAKAECEIAAADVAVNDLLKAAEAKPLLDDAAKQMGKVRSGPIAAELRRVQGDIFAAAGDGDSARKAYLEGEEIGGGARRFSEKAAWRGAHARSTEEFLKQKQFDRAAEEIQAWQREFPAEKIEGYLTLLQARYWAGRGRHAQAIAQAEQLQAVNRDSPYLDQILFVAADSEMRLGHKDRALATLQSVLKDCPGSPMIPLAKKNIELIESGKEGKD